LVLQVTNSPFSQEQVELLNRLLPALTESQRIWLSGYLSALSGAAAVGAAPAATASGTVPTAAPSISKDVTVLYGSQTGNSQRLSKKLTEKLQAQGFQVTLSSMGDFKTNNLKKVQNLLIVVSTHGEGDPPDNAIPFHEFLLGKRAPQLDGMRFSVLALGDTSYEFFCQTGKDFDKRLEELGATRLAPRVDCDVDYDEAAAEWMERVFAALNEGAGGASPGASAAAAASVATGESLYSRTNPFPAEVLENLNLNGRGSDRETRHVELSLDGSGLENYEPGDCLGVFPQNHPQLVEDILAAMGWKADELVPVGKNGEERPLRDALSGSYEITLLTKPLIEAAAKLSGKSALQELTAPGREAELKAYMGERDLLDLITDYGLQGIPAREFVGILRKLPARLYSISSSAKANPGEVHVTIRTVKYEAHGRQRYGVCSTFAAERLEPGEKVPVYIHNNAVEPGRADHHDRAGHGRCPVPGVPRRPRGDGRDRQDVAVLRRPAFLHGLLISNRLAALVERRRADPHGRSVLARHGQKGVRAASDAREEQGAVRLAAGRRPCIRLRRRETDGARRARRARVDHRARGRLQRRRSGGVLEPHAARPQIPTRRLLRGNAKGVNARHVRK